MYVNRQSNWVLFIISHSGKPILRMAKLVVDMCGYWTIEFPYM